MRLKSLLLESKDHTVTIQLINDKRKPVGKPIEKVKIIQDGDSYKFKASGLKAISDAISGLYIEIVDYHFDGKNIIRDIDGKIIAVILETTKIKTTAKKHEVEKKETPKPQKKKEIKKKSEKSNNTDNPVQDILKNTYI